MQSKVSVVRVALEVCHKLLSKKMDKYIHHMPWPIDLRLKHISILHALNTRHQIKGCIEILIDIPCW